jgi:phosphoglycerate kinase
VRGLDSLDVAGKTVLVRVDFNVPLSPTGEIEDDTRIRAALPTLRELRERGAGKLLLASHLGRPKGVDPKQSLAPVGSRLAELLSTGVEVLPVDLEQARSALHSAPAGVVRLLENTRFYPGETKNDPELARRFAALADAYVNDAFGSAHRAHASTEGVARLLPSAAGRLLEGEVRALARLLEAPERPFVAVLGGAKVSDKIGVIRNLLPRVDRCLIGGAMANTFLLARGLDVGKSLVEPDNVETARQLLGGAGAETLELPRDCVVAEDLSRPETAATVRVNAVPSGLAVYDIGPDTARAYADAVRGASTVVWNGPMGVFETERFAEGTLAVARAVAECEGYTVIGGGDSVSAVHRAGVASRVSHISTGGGASLEFLEGRALPGIAVLEG